MVSEPPPLPGVLAEIARIAGNAAALQVAAAKGGCEKIHIPRPSRLKSGHWLVEAVGLEAAVKIAAVLGINKFDIPLGPFQGERRRTRDALRRALESGASTAKAARLAGVHQRTARRLRTAAGIGASVQIELPLPPRR